MKAKEDIAPIDPTVTASEHIADLAAIHQALSAILSTVSKLEHAMSADDARAKQAALKDASKYLDDAIDAVGTVKEHISVAELMSDLSDDEREILRKRLCGGEDEDDE